jgi:carotenoid 1,2-hydratase
MPTLPLYSPNPVPDAWHRVTAPGGYEWWHFDAESADGDVQLVAMLSYGCAFHPKYLREYFRYRAWPTWAAPPVPGEYPCAYFVVYEHGNVVGQFVSQVPPDQFSASNVEPAVRVGPNELTPASDGSLSLKINGVPWELTWRGPTRQLGWTLSADLMFRPVLRHPPHERVFLSRKLSSAEHHWVIPTALCEVEGRVRLSSGAGRKTREIPFRGRGYHDHRYGTAPIGVGLRRSMWGRVLLDERALTFHYAEPQDPGLSNEPHLVEASPAGVREIPLGDVQAEWSERSAARLHYPRGLRLKPTEGDEVELTNPRVLDSSPFSLRLLYTASVGSSAGTALCEVAYPHRLRWPVLGRVIERFFESPLPVR